MGIGGTGADQKIICKAGDLIDPQELNISALFLVQGLGHFISYFFCT
jgi:hypothetical protein